MDDFIPQVGYRDLRFGMSPAEVAKIVGPEKTSTNLWEQFPDFPYDDDELPFVKDCVSKEYEGYKNFHDYFATTFYQDRLVSMFIMDSRVPINFRDIDLFSPNRNLVTDRLFELDKDLYGDREKGFFGQLGIFTVWPYYWKEFHYIKLVVSEYVFDRMELDFYKKLDAPLVLEN